MFVIYQTLLTKQTVIVRFAVLVSLFAFGDGFWFRSPRQLEHSPFLPEFVLLKWGVFSKTGWVSVRRDDVNHGFLCRSKIESFAWITHRLSEGEVLSSAAANKLGVELNRLLHETCFSGVELDIEPIPSGSQWLKGFLREIRAKLKAEYRLHAAIPPVSSENWVGLTWKEQEALSVLEEIDGVDLMLYDTGAANEKKYIDLLHENFRFAKKAMSQFSNKKMVLGFAAYKDKTKKHRLTVENLKIALKALKEFPDSKNLLCHPLSLRVVYYAGWTMDGEDVKVAHQLIQWRKTLCGGKDV